MGQKVTYFTVFKFLLHLLILPVDVIIGGRLLAQSHWTWGALTLCWVAGGLLVSLCTVTVGKFSTGDFMSCAKFFALSSRVHAEFIGALFHSAPQVITQIAIFWSGIYGHDFEVYNQVGSVNWLFAVLEILSPTLNFLSFVSTGISYNGEPGTWARQLCHALSVITTALLRIFIYSVIFKLSPLISIGILMFLFTIAVIFYSLNKEKWLCPVLAYLSLLVPCGHNNAQGMKSGKFPYLAGIPELERSRINHEGMLSRIHRYFGLQLFFTLCLIIPVIVFCEVWLFVPDHEFEVAPILESRLFVYCTGFTLTVITLLMYGLYYIQCRAAREAARTWTGLTPARSPLVARQSEPETAQATTTQREETDVSCPVSHRPVSATASAVDHRRGHYSPSAPRIQSEVRTSGGYFPPGNRKCDHEECVTCTWMIEGPYFYSSVTRKQYLFMTPVTCTDTSIIYMVTCNRCSKQYVGKTQNSLRDRHYGHRREIDTLSTPLGKHFGEVCGMGSWRIQIIDKCQSSELKSREAYWMHEVKSLSPTGLNIRDETARGAGGEGDFRGAGGVSPRGIVEPDLRSWTLRGV